MDKKELLRIIPKVDELLNNKKIDELKELFPRTLIVEGIREALDKIRERILNTPENEILELYINPDSIADDVANRVSKLNKRHLRRVINAAGVIIHTNLGRSILCDEALDAVLDAAGNYCNLEYDTAKGIRGSRYSHLDEIIKRITGAESSIAVNNNAAAVLLVLSTLCKDKEVIVSRGELVEIGGSFRIPEVMEQSGTRLIEVGSTNKTHLYDYKNAINENTGAILKVHTSNYRILGFTEEVSTKELSHLAKANNLPLINDIGSGSFIDFSKYGMEYEPTVKDAINNGADVVTFSGDKMLGGPQAGIITGSKKYIDLMKKNPLTRALRPDKMTIAALEATLRIYIEEDKAIENIPTLRMITEDKEKVKLKAQRLSRMIKSILSDRAKISIIEENSQIGGGSMPLQLLPTYALAINSLNISPEVLEERLRNADIPIIARLKNDSILMDLRTVRDEELTIIKDTINKVL
ncbi:L-seryl-tRNA(Sec) selenium transferase [Oxobacter pfennigii]|uniref:L-seryl-tRNA(Sec) selenium transferase n=1 Tax=Oxobacter pfennigii TaxID=36849 RepID=A0A0P8X070_9CLOT|nr:L-seryl-tRNA(Sec) selenium transferase [Oxobacter pfennigii]KPU44146.1 L-seryl-tRNA(Sec) selenium transferase [Oxobacter pfennigii]